MLDKLKISAFKIIAFIGVFSFFYPGALTTRSFLFKTTGGGNCLLLALLLLFGGFLTAFVLRKNEVLLFSKLASNSLAESIFEGNNNISSLSKLAAYTTLVVPIIISVAVFRGEGIERMMFEVVMSILFYSMGIKNHNDEYNEILSDFVIKGGVFITFASLLVSYTLHVDSYIFLFPYVSLMSYMIIANQSNIDRVFIRMNRQLSGVSNGIRTFNLFFILAVFAITALLLNFKDIVAFLVNIGYEVINAAFTLLLFIWCLLYPKPEAGIKPEPGENITPSSGNMDANPLINLILGIILCSILAYVIYRFLPPILKALGNMLKISELKNEIDDEYRDEIERLVVERRGKRSEKQKRRRTFRGLEKISDIAARVRYLYGIMLDVLILNKVEIKRCDTTGEILQKTTLLDLDVKYISVITDAYEKVRYGNKNPAEEDVKAMQNCCIKVYEHIEGKKR